MHSLCIQLHSKSTGVPTFNFVNGSDSFYHESMVTRTDSKLSKYFLIKTA